MTRPKHLWSGDWQAESSNPPTEPLPQVRHAEEPRTEPLPLRRPIRPLWQVVLPAAAILLVVAVALAELMPGGGHAPRPAQATTPSASVFPGPTSPPSSTGQTTTPTPAVSGRTVNWLGMQISTVAGVGVVIQTVQLNSPADAAGLDPGDIIESVNHRTITSAAQIRSATNDLKTGEAVAISVDRGSTIFSTLAAFAGHPTTSP